MLKPALPKLQGGMTRSAAHDSAELAFVAALSELLVSREEEEVTWGETEWGEGE